MTFHFERKLLELGGLVEMFQADFTSVRERSGVAAPVRWQRVVVLLQEHLGVAAL